MNKLLIALTAALLAAPAAIADPQIEDWKTPHSMGCMMMRECVEGTHLVSTVADVEQVLTHPDYNGVRTEADAIIAELQTLGVNVYLADEKYFPPGHAGVYYVTGNDLFLNDSWVDDPVSFLRTLRHEGWHAAQDSMAGTIENGFMAVIENDKDIPREYVLAAEVLYPESARPWEQEAKWAGGTPNMTLEVLRAINSSNGKPWTVLEPTPMTQEWLEDNGYM
jgi:hypothetical protein